MDSWQTAVFGAFKYIRAPQFKRKILKTLKTKRHWLKGGTYQCCRPMPSYAGKPAMAIGFNGRTEGCPPAVNRSLACRNRRHSPWSIAFSCWHALSPHLSPACRACQSHAAPCSGSSSYHALIVPWFSKSQGSKSQRSARQRFTQPCYWLFNSYWILQAKLH